MNVKRHTKILELIKTENIGTQEELMSRLSEEGFDAAQATISRDIHDLKLTKVTTPDGFQKYMALSGVVAQFSERQLAVFRNSVTEMDFAGNLVVVKTYPGMAMAVAACIDAMSFYEVLGCIAGDDTIFCAVKTEAFAQSLIRHLNAILKADE